MPLPLATFETTEAEEKGCPAADHQRPPAPDRGGSGGDSSAGPAEFREHTQQNGTEYGFTGAKPRGEQSYLILTYGKLLKYLKIVVIVLFLLG